MTKKQIKANRKNAKHSTGPRTDQGKQRCSQNAIKHGLRSKHPVIPGEDPTEYQHKLEKLRDDIRPLNALEDDLVEQIADTSWRLKRLSHIEAAFERYRIEEETGKSYNAGKDDEQILGNAFSFDPLTRLARYESQLSRRYHRAVKELRDLRKDREQIFLRERPMEERDREEQQWRKRHPQPPPEQHQPAAAATANGASVPRTDPGDNIEPAGQTESVATGLDSMSWNEIGELHPDEVLKIIDKNLQAVLPTSGQLGPQEAQK